MGDISGGLMICRHCSEQSEECFSMLNEEDRTTGRMAWITVICLLITLPFVTTFSQTFRKSILLNVFAELESVQETQLKCFNDEKLTAARNKENWEGKAKMTMTIIFLKWSQALQWPQNYSNIDGTQRKWRQKWDWRKRGRESKSQTVIHDTERMNYVEKGKHCWLVCR